MSRLVQEIGPWWRSFCEFHAKHNYFCRKALAGEFLSEQETEAIIKLYKESKDETEN